MLKTLQAVEQLLLTDHRKLLERYTTLPGITGTAGYFKWTQKTLEFTTITMRWALKKSSTVVLYV